MSAESTFECDWCKNRFKTKGTLITHQRTARYCISKRGDIGSGYECEYCGKILTQKGVLEQHQKRSCIKYKISLIEERYKPQLEEKEQQIQNLLEEISILKDKIKSLKEKYETVDYECKELATKSGLMYAEGIKEGVKIAPTIKNTTKNYINPKLAKINITGIPPLTERYVKDLIKQGEYTREMFRMREDGIVEFISNLISREDENGIIHRNYVCTDSSRDKFHRLLETKEWSEDNGAYFCGKILDLLKEPVTDFNKEYNRRYSRACEIDDNESEIQHLDDVMEKLIPFVCGVLYGGEDREIIFNRIRNKIRKRASV